MNELVGEAEIGAEPEIGPAMMQDKTDGVGRVMRHGESLDRDVAHGELRAGEEEPELLAASLAHGALDGIGGKRVAIDRGPELFAKNVEAAGVIAMLVCDEDGVDGRGVDGRRREPGANLARAEAAIDEKAAGGSLDQGAISGAARAEDGHSEHDEINAPKGGGKANRIANFRFSILDFRLFSRRNLR
jgi:hypothetical protein